jgi:hypothetical protein
MKYVASEKILYTTDDRPMKTLHCPLNKQWNKLSTTSSGRVRYCSSCEKNVTDITNFNEEQVTVIFEVNPDHCVYLDLRGGQTEVEAIGDLRDDWEEWEECTTKQSMLPTINTARDLVAMNRAVKEGYHLIIRSTRPETAPKSTVMIHTLDENELSISGYDFCSNKSLEANIGQKSYGINKSPFAAYLIPKDLEKGTKVFIPDLIEHIEIRHFVLQEYDCRRNSGEAIWDGDNLNIIEEHYLQIMG